MTRRAHASDHFDGKRFHNESRQPRGFRDLLRWMRNRQRGSWPQQVPVVPSRPPERVSGDTLRVTFVNHATILLQTRSLNVLTDPIWSRRAGPGLGLGPRRVAEPGVRFEDLPPIDVVLVSHNHYDHLDTATLRRLHARFRPKFICAIGVGKLLRRAGVRVEAELDWWEAAPLSSESTLHCVPAQHFSARTPFDRDRTLWCGYVLDNGSSQIYFAADTGFGPHFQEIASRFSSIRLAALPIGAFEPRWFMSPVHMSPEEALQAHDILRAKTSLGIHWGTFELADDGYELPRQLVEQQVGERDFRVLANGGHIQFASI